MPGVIMSNHLHLALGAAEQHFLPNIIRDFKKFTSVALVRAINATGQENQKE